MSLRFFLSIFANTIRFLIPRCVRFKNAHISETLIMKNSRSIAGECILFRKIFIGGCDGLSYGAFTSKYLRVGWTNFLFFFFHPYVMPVAYSWHPRKDRKVCVIAMRTILRRVHPPADLCYHMVLRYHQLEREIDVENISPFNTSLFVPSTPSFSLSLPFSFSFFLSMMT